MGFAQSWLSIKGKPPEAILAALGLHRTGNREEFTDSPISGFVSPSGWYVVIGQFNERARFDASIASKLSHDCEVILGIIEEHVMLSHAAKWINGQTAWSVTHDAQQGREHLELEGIMPPQFEATRERLFAKQLAAGGPKADVDYIFDIPVDVILAETGYRYDRDIEGADEEPYEVLELAGKVKPVAGGKKSWISKLFGG